MLNVRTRNYFENFLFCQCPNICIYLRMKLISCYVDPYVELVCATVKGEPKPNSSLPVLCPYWQNARTVDYYYSSEIGTVGNHWSQVRTIRCMHKNLPTQFSQLLTSHNLSCSDETQFLYNWSTLNASGRLLPSEGQIVDSTAPS